MNQIELPQGRRLTKQRQIILDELKKVRSHPSAFEVYELVRKKLSKISLGTVYRNLKFLHAHGYIKALACDCCDCEHFDGYTDHNEHFTCKVCQRVYDLKVPLVKSISLTKIEGHQVEEYSINLVGVCSKCLKSNHIIK